MQNQAENMFSSKASFQNIGQPDQDRIEDNYEVDFQREETNTAEFKESLKTLKKQKTNSTLQDSPAKSLRRANKKSQSLDKKQAKEFMTQPKDKLVNDLKGSKHS